MKKIKKQTIGTSQIKEERDIMAGVDSEWITSLQYAFQDPDYLYLVMEYLPGGDLLSLMIRNGPFDEDLARFYLAELTLALNALHTMGYAHRDVKPENILLDRCGHLKLADFGNATALNKDGTVTSLSPVGTPDYIAPELLEIFNSSKISNISPTTLSKHDVTCDFWSMGIIGYELITEETPFHHDNAFETYNKVLNHCKPDSNGRERRLSFPMGIIISEDFKDLIDKLVTKPMKRLTYQQIIKHKYFNGVNWESLRRQVPPIIPSVSGDDDTSNFEEIDKNKKRNTYNTKSNLIGNSKEFSGENLPFLGYSYVHEELNDERYNDKTVDFSNKRLDELQKKMTEQIREIKVLEEKLLNAERKVMTSNSLDKILKDTKVELNIMKDKLKEKTSELASCRTEIKTLKSYLKIEEDSRLKNESTISDVLSSTYQKWEKAKNFSDKNYEKQIVDKKNEISNLSEKLRIREGELTTKIEECEHLQGTVKNYKDLLRSSKEQNTSDRCEYEKTRKQLLDGYEAKISELKLRLKSEKENKNRQVEEMKDLRKELDDSICSSISVSEVKRTSDRNITEIKSRLNRQIEENNGLREMNSKIERSLQDLQKRFIETEGELQKLRESTANHSNRSSDAHSDAYRTPHGSLNDLSPQLEEQLRNDLMIAKENEIIQTKRVESANDIIKKLEEVIAKFNQNGNADILEKQNEKLEGKLASVSEQAILERQSARTANLSLWKVEKKLEDVQLEKKTIARRLEQSEERLLKLKEEKMEAEMKARQNRELIQSKEKDFVELKKEIDDLKGEIRKEHLRWERSERERSKEKLEIVENMSKIHKLEEVIEEGKRKLNSIQQKYDGLTFENKRLIKELSEQRENFHHSNDLKCDLEAELNSFKKNYEMLKEACIITEAQLTEIENMLESEAKQNKSNCDKIDDLYAKLREKDDDIMKLRQEMSQERSSKITAETKAYQAQTECDETNTVLDNLRVQFIQQQEELIVKTKSLYEVQEKLELLTSDSSNLQRLNMNYDHELIGLKEENTKILTDLFIAKEETNNLLRDLKDSRNKSNDYKSEIDHLNTILAEQKTYYNQRDIKAEATMAQHKKLIDYLQAKVEEYQPKKKKNLTDRLFGVNTTSKKENQPPPVELSLQYKKLQDELKKERVRSIQLKEQLLKAKTDMRELKVMSPSTATTTEAVVHPLTTINHPTTSSSLNRNHEESRRIIETETINEERIRESVRMTRTSTSTLSSTMTTTQQHHRFEMTLDNPGDGHAFISCVVCRCPIITGQTHFRCKECKSSVHRKCRSEVSMICEAHEIVQIHNDAMAMGTTTATTEDDFSDDGEEIEMRDTDEGEFPGQHLFKLSEITGDSTHLRINTIYEINEDTILLGCESGLFSYHRHSREFVHITGIKSVNEIAVTPRLSKAILIGSDGENLYQCDLRHLQCRGEASAMLKPKLEASVLDLPFANRVTSERWHLVKIHGDNQSLPEAIVIAATSSRILILRFDIMLGRFKPVRALDTATGIASVLFTRHTAIVSSDKFFEIDLTSYAAEEFLDMSDQTIQHAFGCQPIAAFRVNKQEFLLCFIEFGLFVDEYGCRSRPDDLNWTYNPTGFIYREPLLFISHATSVQVLRVNKSYSSEKEMKESGQTELRGFVNVPTPKLMADAGKLSVYVLTTQVENNNCEKLIVIDGVKTLKAQNSESMETIRSSMMGAVSTDTILTVGTNESDF